MEDTLVQKTWTTINLSINSLKYGVTIFLFDERYLHLHEGQVVLQEYLDLNQKQL